MSIAMFSHSILRSCTSTVLFHLTFSIILTTAFPVVPFNPESNIHRATSYGTRSTDSNSLLDEVVNELVQNQQRPDVGKPAPEERPQDFDSLLYTVSIWLNMLALIAVIGLVIAIYYLVRIVVYLDDEISSMREVMQQLEISDAWARKQAETRIL